MPIVYSLLTTQASGLFIAGPASGADAIPTFRALVGTDLNTFTNAMPATIAKATQLGTLIDGFSNASPSISFTQADGVTKHVLQGRSDGRFQILQNTTEMMDMKLGSDVKVYLPIAMNSNAIAGITATTTQRLIGGSSAPTIAPGTGAGASGTTTLVGTDLSGTITVNTVNTDTPAANAVIATITFNTTYSAAPRVLVEATTDTSWNLAYGVVRCRQEDVTTTTFTLRSGGVALPALTAATYKFNYMVIQ